MWPKCRLLVLIQELLQKVCVNCLAIGYIVTHGYLYSKIIGQTNIILNIRIVFHTWMRVLLFLFFTYIYIFGLFYFYHSCLCFVLHTSGTSTLTCYLLPIEPFSCCSKIIISLAGSIKYLSIDLSILPILFCWAFTAAITISCCSFVGLSAFSFSSSGLRSCDCPLQ